MRSFLLVLALMPGGFAAPQDPASQTAAPQATAPQATAPQAIAPQTTAPQATAPQAAAPQATAPQTTAPQTTAPQTTAPQVAEAPVVAPRDAAPQMESLSMRNAKPGDVIDIVGIGLSDRKIDEVYLTDHKFDMRVKLLEQNDTLIRFRVPPFAKPGRMQILALTKGDDPKLLEQPLYILIEETATQVTQVKAPDVTPKPETHETKDAIKQDK
jgi:hypothetical protein